MADTARDAKKKTGSGGGGIVRAMSKKLLMPIVATAVSAVAAYAAKRGPQLLEDKVLPRVKDATTGAGGAAEEVADRAKSVGGTIGTAADDVAKRAKAVVTSNDGASSDA